MYVKLGGPKDNEYAHPIDLVPIVDLNKGQASGEGAKGQEQGGGGAGKCTARQPARLSGASMQQQGACSSCPPGLTRLQLACLPACLPGAS